MQTQSVRRNSLWTATGVVPQPGPLSADIQVDVCVIGAGIAGLTTAYLLAREGKVVAVLDDRREARPYLKALRKAASGTMSIGTREQRDAVLEDR